MYSTIIAIQPARKPEVAKNVSTKITAVSPLPTIKTPASINSAAQVALWNNWNKPSPLVQLNG